MLEVLKKSPVNECVATPGNRPSPAAKVLAISHSNEYLSSLKRILEATPFHVVAVRTYRQALAALCSDRVPVIVCQCGYHDGNWKDIISQIAPLLERPRVIVTSTDPAERLYQEAQAMGASRVLAEPLDPDQTTDAICVAWSDWRTEQIRNRKAHAAAV